MDKHCKWYNDEFCTNADSPCVADYCPVVEYPELCKHREVDEGINAHSKTEEKKLTDEEALKAVEICHTVGLHCSTCPAYEYEGDNCDHIAGLALVDYCRRLQRENERLTEELKYYRGELL
jgi:hypothetical protein